MAEITTKDVLTLEELKNLTGQAAKAAVIYDTSTGEPSGLDVEIFINMDASIGVVDASLALTDASLALTNARLALTDASLAAKQSIANLSNNIITDAASTTKYPSVKEIKDYADGLVVGLMDDRGNYNASLGVYPSTGGSGAGGAILKGDIWFISVAGTIDSHYYEVGDSIRALVDNPAQVSANWGSMNSNLTYVPEDVANKKTEISESDQHYPTNGAVHRHVAAEKVSIIESLTGQIDGGVSSSVYGGCGVVDGGSPSTIF